VSAVSPAVLSLLAQPLPAMARLQPYPSATPQPTRYTRASTTDSLYRDPSVRPRASRAPTSTMDPSQSFASDKENDTPSAHQNGNKRRRTDEYSVTQDDGEDSNDDDDDDDDHVEQDDEPPAQPDLDEEQGDQKFYNPNQDPEKRRRLRATMRDHQRMVQGPPPPPRHTPRD
jgi:hypothetical protein